MYTDILTFQAAGIRASALPGHQARRKITSSSSPTNWWTPLFGWSSEPDYIDSKNDKANNGSGSLKTEHRPVPDLDLKTYKSTRFAPGCFTEEKAKQLRMITTETGTFHDVMYHSAIASRLASDFKKSTS